MLATQYEFMPHMLQSSAYNCSASMPVGRAWADEYGEKHVVFGVYSVAFGVITEILYVPCMVGLGRDLRTSCIKIMFWLAILDMFAITANCIGFGILLLDGAVYCSNPVATAAVGIMGYVMWCTASTCCIVLALNRLFDMLGLSEYFCKQ
ncbi:hypothetical protein PFISCL1PPCAC_13945 [Pristionchus fissidentatus]|uniref:G protein-coupled receptor n=1 Tax=Pristionchus fissidentatus TaxID=1538716 RepID=A0AAV5VWK4_9BILA|nr:hypothetical protein PFISCL1PPCAC_13945 [Pristionchus fissidentatus]